MIPSTSTFRRRTLIYNNMTDKVYEMATAAQYAMQYLRKMRQWKEGKIDLAVPGCDPPRMMSDEELAEQERMVNDLIAYLDDYV